jgi:hypothetical protein
MIQSVYTPTVIYRAYSDEYTDRENRIVLTNCKMEQTSYGSIKITRKKVDNVVELYPQSILHVIHIKE